MSIRPRPAPSLLRPAAAGLGLALLALASRPLAAADPKTNAPPPYGLDTLPRVVAPHGPIRCPRVELVDYRGEVIRYSAPARVFPGFRDRLVKFEQVARDVAVEVYGRPPSRVVQLGTYSCRRIAAYPDWLSEHGLGNAIDIEGFNFGPLPKGERLPEGVPAALKGPFEVRVLSHWKPRLGHAPIHARFLKLLARRLVARSDVFRVLLGPGYAGHDNHFHFDMAPFRMVEIYEDGQLITAAPSS